MARIFKQCYTKRTAGGTTVKARSRKWYVEYRDAQGIRRRVPGYIDKQATQQLAAELERRAAREASGLVDKFAEHRRRPLSEHLIDYREHLGTVATLSHVNTCISRIRKVLTTCRFTFWSDLSASKVQAFVADLGRCHGRSIQTCNSYLQTVKTFCRWMVRNGRAPDNPLQYLQGGNIRTDRRHDRRAFTDDELRRLLDGTRIAPERFGMTGADRARLYQLAVETGLRVRELRSLTWASFDLDGDLPTVTVKAAYSKHRREDTLPLARSTATMLGRRRDETGRTGSEHQVFATMPRKDVIVTMLRADLADASIAYRDDAGLVVDFHAFRHTFISNLAHGGVHPKVAQQLARHSTITLTMDRYTHTAIGDLAGALDALPDLSSSKPEGERLRSTGTCDIAPKSLPPGLPKSLPICLPTRVASQTSPVASHCTKTANGSSVSHQDKPVEQGVSCTSVHRVAPACTRSSGGSDHQHDTPLNGETGHSLFGRGSLCPR